MNGAPAVGHERSKPSRPKFLPLLTDDGQLSGHESGSSIGSSRPSTDVHPWIEKLLLSSQGAIKDGDHEQAAISTSIAFMTRAAIALDSSPVSCCRPCTVPNLPCVASSQLALSLPLAQHGAVGVGGGDDDMRAGGARLP